MIMANVDWTKLTFSYTKTNTILTCTFKDGKWGNVESLDNDNITISSFAGALHYSIECDEDIMKEKILRLLLQPLIENSIKHGIEQTGKDEHILVRIRKENGLLSIVVSDDGPGIDPDTLKYLWQLWNAAGQEYHKETRSVGLYNVFRRLSLTYGDRVHLTIASSKETGTMVEIRISEEN